MAITTQKRRRLSIRNFHTTFMQEQVEVQQNIQSTPIVLFTLLLSAGFLLFPLQSPASSIQAKEWNITADKITRYEDPPSIIAEGNVILKKIESVTRKKKNNRTTDWTSLLGEEDTTGKEEKEETVTERKTLTTIKADWIAYDVDLGKIKARGNLLIDIGPDQLSAESGTVDLNRETGTFRNATIIRQYKDMHLEGRVIEKTGDLTYHIEDGWIITCKVKEGETPPWSFAASDAEITENGYAFLKNATFRIKDIPVLYMPIIFLPAKTSRQTGFLFPSVGLSDRDGFDFTAPFFINLSPSSDITLYPEYISERGFMTGIEARYTTDPTSMGFFMANFLNDDLSDPDDPGNADYYADGGFTHTNQERYWVRGKANQNFGQWTTRLDLDVASDLDYLTEFNSGLTGFITSQNRFFDTFGRGFQNKTSLTRENTLKVLRSWDNGSSLQINLLGINDLREPKTSPDPLWNLPAINYSGLLPIYDTGVDFSWDTNYTNFWRDKGVRAQRIDLPLKLIAGVPLSPYLETTVDAGIRNTSYLIDDNGDEAWKDSDTENRFLVEFGGKVGTDIARDFNINVGEIYRWSHTFRPSISYRYVSDDDQDNLPQFDDIDRVANQNIIYYNLDNFFSIFGLHNGSEYDRQYGYLKIRQGYDFRSEKSDTPLTPVEIKAALFPIKDFRLVYRSDIDVYGAGVLRNALETSYKNGRGDTFYFDYFSSNNEDENDTESIKGGARISLLYSLIASYDIERSLEDSQTVQENFSLIYQPSCWSVEFATNYTPGNQKYMVMFRLANIGNPFGIDLPGI
ncbi:MAG TPA: LPS-assembly protein LptD [Desulfobulbaceae bacterium]|nr:LPS-assembly protein LptD [Desulfobulbaceae bacterium]